MDVADDVAGSVADVRQIVGAGADPGVLLAAAYHTSRDVLPRNLKRRVHFSPAGLAFPADPARYPGGLPPLAHLPVCDGRDLLADTASSCRQQDVRLDAWLVYLHHDADISAGTSGRVVNAFGDVNSVALCPASPVTFSYATVMTAEVCDRQPAGILAEALHQQPVAHGFHHERSFVSLGGLAKVLLGICFCRHCITAGEQSGLDVSALRAWIRTVVDGPQATVALPSRHEVAQMARQHVDSETVTGYLDLRRETVRTLQHACADVAQASGVSFTVFDPSEVLAEADTSAPKASTSWQIGLDGASIGPSGLAPAFYVGSTESLRQQLARVVAEVGAAPAGAVLRVVGEDLARGADLAEAVQLLDSAGVEWIGYYHYGLAPAERLAGIATAHCAAPA